MSKKKRIILWSIAGIVLITTFVVFAANYYFSTWPELLNASGNCVTCDDVFFDGTRTKQDNPCDGSIARTEDVGSEEWHSNESCSNWYEGSCADREYCWDCDDYKYQPTETWTCETCCVEPVEELGSSSDSESVNIDRVPLTIDLGEESATCNGAVGGSCGGETITRSCQSGCCSSCEFGELYISETWQPSGYLYCDGHNPAEVVDTITATYPNQYTVYKIPDSISGCSGCDMDRIESNPDCGKCSPTWTEYCPNECVDADCPQKQPNSNLCDGSRSTCSEDGWVGAWHWKVTHTYDAKGRHTDTRQGSSDCRDDPDYTPPCPSAP